MNIEGNHWRTIWLDEGGKSFSVIDQNQLPHKFQTLSIKTWTEAVNAISKMTVRGAPLIGVAGAYGLMLALQEDPRDEAFQNAYQQLIATRPTAVNLKWALDRLYYKVIALPVEERVEAAKREADSIAEEDVSICESIGFHGLSLIKKIQANKSVDDSSKPLNILTHCNAGWLATVDWGTALAPIYKAHHAGLNIHVWVDETRPRNQGASLTAFELASEGVPHTVIVDNAGGYLMQKGDVDIVIVGSDRTTSRGDVCNKIGTYLKALAAHANSIPFYVALPCSSIDWEIEDGLKEIKVECRSSKEVTHIKGITTKSDSLLEMELVQLVPDGCVGFNPAFDITPAHLVSGLLTEYGIVKASKEGLKELLEIL